MENILKITQVEKYYGNKVSLTKALDNISLEVAKGEFVAIIGHNGSGKSTLSKNLNAILVPTQGDIYIDGMNTKDESKLWNIRQTAGMVFQNPDNQIVATMVEEDVAFGPENLGVPPQEIRQRVDVALEKVGMSEYKRHAPHLLSGGQKQKIALARALLKKPKVLLLDEPTSALDPISTSRIEDLVLELKDKYTIVMVTHNMQQATRVSDRTVFFLLGEVVEMDKTEKLFSMPTDKRTEDYITGRFG